MTRAQHPWFQVWCLGLLVLGCNLSLPRCKVKCGVGPAACPGGMSCGDDGFCYAPGDPQNCTTVNLPPGSIAWQDVGPFVSAALGVKPDNADRLFVGGKSEYVGAFASTDGGSAWTAVATIGSESVYAYAWDGDTVYAGATSGMWYRDGMTGVWSHLFSTPQIKALAIGSGVVHAGAANGQIVWWSGTPMSSTFRSTLLPGASTSVDIKAVVLDPTDPMRVYAGGSTVWRTTDGGMVWSSTGQGLPFPNADVTALAMDPGNHDVIYAASGGGLYRTANATSQCNWSLVPPLGQGINATSVTITSGSPRTIYVGTSRGLFRSSDGTSWSSATSGPSTGQMVWAIGSSPMDPTRIYIGTDAGVFKSIDGGLSGWTRISQGLLPVWTPLALAQGQDGTIYLGTSRGVSISSTGGTSWRGGFSSRGVASIAVDATSPRWVYLGTLEPNDRQGTGIFHYNLDGAPGAYVNSGLPCSGSDCLGITALAAEPTTGALYAGTAAGNLGTNGAGIYRASSAGASWSALYTDTTLNCHAVLILASDLVFAGTNQGVLKLVGGTFIPYNSGLPAMVDVLGLAVAPGMPQAFTVYAATSSGVFRLPPGSANWLPLGQGLSGPTTQVAVDPQDPMVVYAGAADGVYQTRDGGATAWSRIRMGPPIIGLGVDAMRTVYALDVAVSRGMRVP